MRRGVALAGILLVAGLFAACGSSAPTTSGTTAPASGGGSRPSAAQATRCAVGHTATWMRCLVGTHAGFGNMALSRVAMPGSLDAATYELDPQSFDTHKGSACSDFTESMVPQGPLINRWYTAQSTTLQQQLDAGSRFLDLDVGFNGVDKPTFAWRIDNTLFSQQPLQDYLIDIAVWAKAHPSEVVVVDFRHICVNGATSSIERALWQDVASAQSLFPSGTGGAPVSLASVMFDAGARGAPSLGSLTIDDVLHAQGTGHNVVLLVPSDAPARGIMSRTLHGEPYFVGSGSGDARVAFTGTGVAPTSASGFPAANRSIEQGAHNGPQPIGSLEGQGLYVSPIAYDLASVPATSATRSQLYSAFGGLITGAPPLAAWESGLLPAPNVVSGTAAMPNATSIAHSWGHRANVVATNGLALNYVVPAVISLNGS